MQLLRYVAGLTSVVVVSVLTGLVLAVLLLSVAGGLDRVVVTSGSMRPAIDVGDIVLLDRNVKHPVPVGTVLVFGDPNRPGALLTHRVIEVLPGGHYRTQGDANADADTTPVNPDLVVGRGAFLVPLVGLPAAWTQSGHIERALAASGALALLLWFSRYGLQQKYDPWAVTAAKSRAPRHRRRARSAARTLSLSVAVVFLASTPGVAIAPQLSHAAFTASSSNTGNSLSTAIQAYLAPSAEGNTRSSAILPLRRDAPTTTTLYNYDTNRDSAAGLLLGKSAGLTETDPTKIQRWRFPVSAPLNLTGRATITLWSAIKDFNPSKRGSAEVGVYDCNDSGSSCTRVASAAQTSSGSWSGGSSTWVAKTWALGQLSTTIGVGRVLEIRVVVGGTSEDDMLFAYGTTAYPSRLTIVP